VPGRNDDGEAGRLRVGILAPPWIQVPPPAYGGIEHVVALQTRALIDAGHDVTLFAAPGSHIPGAHMITPLRSIPDQIGAQQEDWLHVLRTHEHAADLDVVIDHSGPLAGVLLSTLPTPVIHVTHGELDAGSIEIYESVARRNPAVRFVAISDSQRRSAPHLPWAAVCHNGLDMSAVPFGPSPGDHLVFLGRMAPEKGASEAIDIARACGRRIMLAAKCREPKERAYFASVIKPKLGPDAVWLGEVDTQAKFELLAGAAALVFPIDWREPFGMVMIEAMACGTPVLATRRGSVPEIVVDGMTGFIRESPHELVECAARVHEIDRTACRTHVERRFGLDNVGSNWNRVVVSIAAARRRRLPPFDAVPSAVSASHERARRLTIVPSDRGRHSTH
jgi:glycosyltransferase involved in cell wall biosynthesis